MWNPLSLFRQKPGVEPVAPPPPPPPAAAKEMAEIRALMKSGELTEATVLARKKLDHRILDIDDPETLALFCALFDALNGQRLSNSKPWQKDNLVNDSNALLQALLRTDATPHVSICNNHLELLTSHRRQIPSAVRWFRRMVDDPLIELNSRSYRIMIYGLAARGQHVISGSRQPTLPSSTLGVADAPDWARQDAASDIASALALKAEARSLGYHTDPATTKAFMYAFMTIHKKTKQDPTRNPGNLVDEMNTFFRQLSPTEINRETYHVMLQLYADMTRPDDAMQLLHTMIRNGYEPEPETFQLVLSAFALSDRYEDIRDYAEWIKHGNCNTPKALTAIMGTFHEETINAAVRSGQYTTVVEWFERLERVGLHTSDKAYLQVVKAHVQADNIAAAEDWVRKFIVDGNVPSVAMVAALLGAYLKAAHTEPELAYARTVRLFEALPKWGVQPKRELFESIVRHPTLFSKQAPPLTALDVGEPAIAQQWLQLVADHHPDRKDVGIQIVANRLATATYTEAVDWFVRMHGTPGGEVSAKMARPATRTYNMLISHCIENGMPAEAQEWYRLLCDETDHDHTVQPNKNTRKLLNKIRFGQPGVTGTGTTAPGVVDNGPCVPVTGMPFGTEPPAPTFQTTGQKLTRKKARARAVLSVRDVALRLQTDEPNIGALLFTAEKAREYEEEVFRRHCARLAEVHGHENPPARPTRLVETVDPDGNAFEFLERTYGQRDIEVIEAAVRDLLRADENRVVGLTGSSSSTAL